MPVQAGHGHRDQTEQEAAPVCRSGELVVPIGMGQSPNLVKMCVFSVPGSAWELQFDIDRLGGQPEAQRLWPQTGPQNISKPPAPMVLVSGLMDVVGIVSTTFPNNHYYIVGILLIDPYRTSEQTTHP